MSTQTTDGETPVDGGPDDFLYHLYRGSTMLLQDQVVEAKEELERALALQPQDAKSQDLLAGVYFRLGLYPRSIEIWRRLVQAYARDATLRVNLALALFKTGQADEALDEIHEALRIQPDHERAWGYLGLIHWRLGHLQEARDAFLRGGQATMARRMEDAIQQSSAGQVPAPQLHDEEELAEQDRAAMRVAAEEALERIDSDNPHLKIASTEARGQTGTWSAVELGSETVPHRTTGIRGTEAPKPPRLAQLLSSWVVKVPEEAPMAIGPSGALFIRSPRDVFVRFKGLAAVRGELRTTTVNRRSRGRELDALLGGSDPILHCHGPIDAVIEPSDDAKFKVFALTGEMLYVRESIVFGFDDRISFESANLPLAGEPVVLTQLHGEGLVVLGVPGEPQAVLVKDGDEVRVDPARLLGWSGRLFPNARRGTAPYAANAPPLVFKGEGVVILG